MDQLNFYSINFHTLVSHSVSQVERKLLCDTIESKREREKLILLLLLFFPILFFFSFSEKKCSASTKKICNQPIETFLSRLSMCVID